MDRVLDRVPQFDERSRAFPVRQVVRAAAKPRGYTWSCGTYLDQGSEGACVGFAWAHELVARPSVITGFTAADARQIYLGAQRVDEWPGEGYSGTSVLAGAKVVAGLGYVSEYRWAFGLDDLILAVGYKGPAVLGLNWYEGMFDPDADGHLRPTGRLAGGHAILCRAVSVRDRRFLLHNSWGSDWGLKGTAWVSFEDMDRLLREQGEACIPVLRRRP